MEKKRSFTRLKKNMSCEEFNKFCKKLTEQYAKSAPQFARSYFTEHYNISADCYYKVLEYAVVTNLVEDLTVSKMMNKAIKNQNLHNSSAGASSVEKYAKMYNQRCKYIANTFTDSEIRKIAIDFADNPDLSKADIATSYGITRKVFELILIRAIEENIVEDRIVDAMELRSIKKSKVQNVEMSKEYFSDLRKKRELNKQGITFK